MLSLGLIYYNKALGISAQWIGIGRCKQKKIKKRMFMAVENMAHANMSVNYSIISAKKKPTYNKIQEIRNSSQRNVK